MVTYGNSDGLVIMCSKEIRTELFISNYNSKNFDIYDKADANEALIKIIGMLHAY